MTEHSMESHARPERRILTREEAAGKLARTARLMTPPPRNWHGGWRCIDGRERRGHLLAAPGGALGFLFAVAAAAEQWARATGRRVPALADLLGPVEAYFGGGLSTHTDDHHADDPLRCAGCGHCAGALKEPERYGIARYAPDLRDYLLRATMPSNVLEGPHREGAVFDVPEAVAMPGSEGDGVDAFILHGRAWKQTLGDLALPVGMAIDADPQAFPGLVLELGARQLGVTDKRLADGLPHLSVEVGENGSIRLSA